MNRMLVAIVISFCSMNVGAQDVFYSAKIKDSVIKSTTFQENIIYLFCRGTYSKVGMVAKYFNLMDTVSTHVGIGYLRKGKLAIYNVTTNSNTNNAFKIESLEEFTSMDDIYSLQVWSIVLNKSDRRKVYGYCSRFSHKVISFDYKFNTANDDTLYCSEFCANLLRYVNATKFNFAPNSKDISNTLFEVILNKKELIYYPVDFFQSNPYFIRQASYIFKN
ncbi:MAG: hypothetical protein ABIN36_08915 [Ferruginibacter sp.]